MGTCSLLTSCSNEFEERNDNETFTFKIVNENFEEEMEKREDKGEWLSLTPKDALEDIEMM